MIYLIICNLFSDLEWKIIYVGSAESEEYDQTLDTVVVGPVIAGRHMFVFEVNIFTFLGRVSWLVFRSWFRDIEVVCNPTNCRQTNSWPVELRTSRLAQMFDWQKKIWFVANCPV